ncbi:LacI family DNA-binding transcriptional regulator [Flavobacterium agrisoli]|uniref:LacI family DNA-binding transcriptional regulator n=1 Tax=Flavobacterium agrisoli TaxID=2793066 RepID=A0A934PNL5_9FLAO|nr:LacI family DNA-binding transcriptional regulator [Flavobacterium agrisoli]MBK0370852.1 LacI family DNA-binding transcriptional regulator [Flavobacterium agrisoli]
MEIKKKTTIKDIATLLGLTPSAVSKALNDHPRISQKTKAAVQEAVIQLNYQPNYLSSALRKGKSNLVGLIVPRINTHFYASVIENIEAILNKNGYNVIMAQTNESYKKECQSIYTLLNIQVDGIIASIASETVDFEFYRKIKQKGVPLVLFDRGENDLEVDYVGIDDYNCSQLIVEHLVQQNCSRIAHITGFSHTRIFKNRIRGFRDALQKWELPVEEDLIIESNLQIEDGRRIMASLLNRKQRPDAVYAASDNAALGALQVLLEKGIKVPEEMALVGFGNEPFSTIMKPEISTINQFSADIGKEAALAFLERIKHPEKKVMLNKIILDAALLVRNSSKRGN